MYLSWITFSIACLALTGLANASQPSPHRMLTKSLLDEYSKWGKYGLPATNEGEAVMVNLSISVVDSFEIAESDRPTMTIEAFMVQSWYEPMLQWDPSEHSRIEQLSLPISAIWAPDTTVIQGKYLEHVPDEDYPAVVSSNGKVRWYRPRTIKVICEMATDESYEDVECGVKFRSRGHSGYSLDYNFDGPVPELLVQNPNWHIEEIIAERRVVFARCCLEPFAELMYRFRIKKQLTTSSPYFLDFFE